MNFSSSKQIMVYLLKIIYENVLILKQKMIDLHSMLFCTFVTYILLYYCTCILFMYKIF